MKLVKINPSLNNPMHHWMDRFFSDINDTFDRSFGVNQVPAVNVIENEKGFELELAAPGLSKGDFNLNIDNDVLKISVEKKTENEETKEEINYRRREFSFTSFSRSFHLPENIDREGIEAKYKNGVLKLTLPKVVVPEVEKVRQIEIK